MSLTRQGLDNFYEARKPYLEEIIGLNFKEHGSKFSEFLNMKSAKTGWVDGATISGFGLFDLRPELQDAATDDIIQGPTARVKILEYAKRHLVSQVAIEDDMGDGIIASRLPGILKAGRATMEVLGHEPLNLGFSSSFTTPDGLPLFSPTNTPHVALDGSTYYNQGTAADLSQTSLQDQILLLETQKDDRGIPIMQVAQKLIVDPSNKWVAQVVLGSAQKVGVDYNDINPMFTQGLTTVESQFITDADSWFLFSNDHMVDWYTRVAPENWSEVDYKKGGVEIGARFRCATAAWDPRGCVGNPGS